MGRHVIVAEEIVHEDGRPVARQVRLRGVFGDAEFFGLPLVAEYGAFPAGYHAGHFGDDDANPSARFYLGLPEADRDARAVLAELRERIAPVRYTVEVPVGEPMRFRTQHEARAAMRRYVYDWRRSASGRTALPDPEDPDAHSAWVPSYVLYERRGGYRSCVGRVRLVATDVRTALRAA